MESPPEVNPRRGSMGWSQLCTPLSIPRKGDGGVWWVMGAPLPLRIVLMLYAIITAQVTLVYVSTHHGEQQIYKREEIELPERRLALYVQTEGLNPKEDNLES